MVRFPWWLSPVVVGLLLGLLLSPTIVPGQTLPQTCEEQVAETYKGLVTDRQIADLPQGTWGQYVSTLASQLRIVTTQYKMQQQATEQAQALAAQQNELARQLQQQIAVFQQRLRDVDAQHLAPAPAK